MPKLTREQYLKRYVGKTIKGGSVKNVRKDKNKRMIKKYERLFAVKDKTNDTLVYIVNGRMRAAKGSTDHKKKSSQSHEKRKPKGAVKQFTDFLGID